MYKRIGNTDKFTLKYFVSNKDVDYDFYRKMIASRVFTAEENRLVCIYTNGKECYYQLDEKESLFIILKSKNDDNVTMHFNQGHA